MTVAIFGMSIFVTYSYVTGFLKGGAQGEVGPKGKDGLNCYEYDGNPNTCLPILEDTNLDGVCNVTDCQCSGNVTITQTSGGNTSSVTQLTTKGDILTRNSTDNTRLPVGTDNEVLTANSTSAEGISWAQVDHVNLANKGTNTHAQIDTHIASTSNPHSVTFSQVNPLTTKGSLISYTGSAVSLLSVGSNTNVLTADSASPNGLSWAQVDHVNLASIGTNTHAQIDTHIASTSNPHSTTFAQVNPMSAKGDLISYTGSAVSVVGVGTNNFVLTANSAASNGLSWAQVDHVNLLNKGTNTHAQIDTHIASTSNPHSVTFTQVSPLTAKGDVITYSGTAPAVLAVGADTRVLTANSAASNGISWSQVDHVNLASIGTNTHAQIDTHIASTSNPHSTTFTQVNPMTTKGDLISYTGAAVSILPIGSNTNVLTANSLATGGFSWSQVDHVNLANIGTNTHAQIDTHIASTSNPHSTTFAQVSPLTTKGDLISYSNAPAILSVGSDGQVLKSDSTASTGLKWVFPPMFATDTTVVSLAADANTGYTTGNILQSNLVIIKRSGLTGVRHDYFPSAASVVAALPASRQVIGHTINILIFNADAPGSGSKVEINDPTDGAFGQPSDVVIVGKRFDIQNGRGALVMYRLTAITTPAADVYNFGADQ
jgi:hypothetical protein